MRTIKELLELVITYLAQGDKMGWYNSGICGEIKDLKETRQISHEEKYCLLNYLAGKRPTRKKYTEFLDTECEYLVFWWPRMEDSPEHREIRIKYLNCLLSEIKMKEGQYYYVSEDVIKSFPDLEKSKPFKRHGDKLGYVAVVPDFDLLIEHYNSNPGDGEYHFAYPCMDSQVDLNYTDVTYDEDDFETEVETKLTLAICQDLGLVAAIEDCLGITKEKNVAFVIHKLAEDNKLNPIDLINKL